MPRISAQTIEQIAAASDIVEIISSYFPLKRAGTELKALCPFHQEKTPSFHVSPAKQSYYCFGCGAGGTVFQFIMDYEHVEFVEAVRRLASRAGLPIVEEQQSVQEEQRQQQRRRLLQLHDDATKWFQQHLLRGKAASHARNYLAARGVNIEIAKRWRLGYAPNGWQTFLPWALDRGYSFEELSQSGLVKQKDQEAKSFYDRFRDRLMFPICNDIGEVIAFSGRVLSSADQTGKYLNSPETVLFSKGTVLFGLHKSKRAIAKARCAVVLEGQLDLITAFEAGFENVVAPQGTALTEKHAALLRRFAEEIILVFDADAAGQRAAERALEILLRAGLQVKMGRLPSGEDPDSLIRKVGAKAFQELINGASDFFDFAAEQNLARGQNPDTASRVAFARQMAEFIAMVSDVVVRDSIINRLASRLALPREAIQEMASSPKRRTSAQSEPSTDVPQRLRHEIAELCRIALSEPETLCWIRQQPWKEVLTQVEGADLLKNVLGSAVEAGDPSNLANFFGTLKKTEAALLAQLLRSKPMDQDIGKVFWTAFALRELRDRKLTLEGIRRIADEGSESWLQADRELKEVLDLETRFKDIPRFLTRAVEPA
jgi:DNA primase